MAYSQPDSPKKEWSMKKRYSEEQLFGLVKEAAPGMPVVELYRAHRFSNASYYNWKGQVWRHENL